MYNGEETGNNYDGLYRDYGGREREREIYIYIYKNKEASRAGDVKLLAGCSSGSYDQGPSVDGRNRAKALVYCPAVGLRFSYLG